MWHSEVPRPRLVFRRWDRETDIDANMSTWGDRGDRRCSNSSASPDKQTEVESLCSAQCVPPLYLQTTFFLDTGQLMGPLVREVSQQKRQKRPASLLQHFPQHCRLSQLSLSLLKVPFSSFCFFSFLYILSTATDSGRLAAAVVEERRREDCEKTVRLIAKAATATAASLPSPPNDSKIIRRGL